MNLEPNKEFCSNGLEIEKLAVFKVSKIVNSKSALVTLFMIDFDRFCTFKPETLQKDAIYNIDILNRIISSARLSEPNFPDASAILNKPECLLLLAAIFLPMCRD